MFFDLYIMSHNNGNLQLVFLFKHQEASFRTKQPFLFQLRAQRRYSVHTHSLTIGPQTIASIALYVFRQTHTLTFSDSNCLFVTYSYCLFFVSIERLAVLIAVSHHVISTAPSVIANRIGNTHTHTHMHCTKLRLHNSKEKQCPSRVSEMQRKKRTESESDGMRGTNIITEQKPYRNVG